MDGGLAEDTRLVLKDETRVHVLAIGLATQAWAEAGRRISSCTRST